MRDPLDRQTLRALRGTEPHTVLWLCMIGSPARVSRQSSAATSFCSPRRNSTCLRRPMATMTLRRKLRLKVTHRSRRRSGNARWLLWRRRRACAMPRYAAASVISPIHLARQQHLVEHLRIMSQSRTIRAFRPVYSRVAKHTHLHGWLDVGLIGVGFAGTGGHGSRGGGACRCDLRA